MNSLLVAWRPVLIVAAVVVAGLFLTGHRGLAAFVAGGCVVLLIMLLTGNLALSGLTMLVIVLVILANLTGYIYYNPTRQYCYDGYHWDGAWQVVWAVGKLELRFRPWYCAPADQFDPGTIKHL